jgi:hypothetical protein
MPYRVRTKDGELTYPSIAELSQAWQLGMVDPDDEVLEEGKEKWRKAGTLPFLVQFSPRGTPLLDRKIRFLVVLALCLATVAIYWLVKGNLVAGALAGLGAAMASMALVRTQYSKK